MVFLLQEATGGEKRSIAQRGRVPAAFMEAVGTGGRSRGGG